MVCNENNEERAPIDRKRASITTIIRTHSFDIVCLSSLFSLCVFMLLFSDVCQRDIPCKRMQFGTKMRQNPVFLCWMFGLLWWVCACFRTPPMMIDSFVWCWWWLVMQSLAFLWKYVIAMMDELIDGHFHRNTIFCSKYFAHFGRYLVQKLCMFLLLIFIFPFLLFLSFNFCLCVLL